MSEGTLFDGHYHQWRKGRLDFIKSLLGEDFTGKTVLELGCGWGHIGREFEALGADVTFSDARQEHLDEVIRVGKPGTKAIHHIAGRGDWPFAQKYDIVLHMGLLYHLSRNQAITSLMQACAAGKVVVLETEVTDADDAGVCPETTEGGFDQAFLGVGCRPSPGFVERIVLDAGKGFVRHEDARLDESGHRYAWVAENNQSYTNGKRRFWIVK